ncbi:hypothetical protein [Actinocrispum wychmicini]|uniref:Acyl-CoA carboxylase epsilon subunit-like protein n=1 Tax=Actinocrispum wychmicini TaxID=1213861 RepID=A0A4R2JL54_9PSEU|nr:hypothetical protein [Actinocrispum wychmicini]TCO60783.1 hypothetical protein EV192_103358 [Actinocrispum wychmicini]
MEPFVVVAKGEPDEFELTALVVALSVMDSTVDTEVARPRCPLRPVLPAASWRR